jgi:hypothetical protein
VQFPEQIETAGELAEALGLNPNNFHNDDPIYATTPHGTYLFVIEKVEHRQYENEKITLLRLREVARTGEIT